MNDLAIKEPYRIFFPLGILLSTIGVGHWLFYGLGLVPNYTSFFHSSIQTLTFVHCFILGFLLTAMPRFSGSPFASHGEVFSFLFLVLGTALFLARGQWFLAEGCFLVSLLALTRFIWIRFAKKRNSIFKIEPPREFIWVGIAILHGLTGAAVLMLCQLGVLPVAFSPMAKTLMEQGYILSVVIGVGGFMLPRLAGTFKVVRKETVAGKEKLTFLKPSRWGPAVHASSGMLLFASFWILDERIAYAARAVVIFTVFFWTGVLPRPPKVKDFYVILAWLSAWFLVLGYTGVAFSPDYRVALLHLAFIGGFSLMIFAVATMVVVSHAGEAKSLHSRLWILWVVLIGLLCALLQRLLAVIFPDAYFQFLSVSSACWLLTAASWLAFILPRIVKTRAIVGFDAMHEEQKQKVTEAMR